MTWGKSSADVRNPAHDWPILIPETKAFRNSVRPRDGPFAGGGLCDELSGLPHDVCFSDEHIALYLHHDGFLQREWPELWAKLHGAMIAPPGSEQGNRVARPLQVRR